MKDKVKLLYEFILVMLAITSVIFIWSEDQQIMVLDRVIWLIFFIDVSIRFFKSDNKKAYIKENPLDFIAIIPLDAIFQLARIARLLRALRIIMIGRRYGKQFFEILKTNGLHRVLTFTVLLVFIAAIPIRYFEPSMDVYADALWWGIVTATTVGYGDISPETGIGRMIAIILMLFGIGLIGMITGSIATYFLKGGKEGSTVEFIKSELDRFDDLTEEEVQRMILLIRELEKEKKIE